MHQFHEILRMEKIVTESMGTRILDNAKFNLFKGEIVGLVGVNYSGKTSLMGGITGHFPYTSGITLLDDASVKVTSIDQARSLGVYQIQTSSSLVNSLTVAENIFLMPEKRHSLFTNKKQTNLKARRLLDEMELNIPVDHDVVELSFYSRVSVEVSKAILNKAKIIVFDNVASAIPSALIERFQLLLYRLQQMGISVVLVEARVQLLTNLCERLFILRDGRTVGTLKRSEFDVDKIVSLMIGHVIRNVELLPEENDTSKEILLELNKIHFGNLLRGLTIAIHRHEVLGILSANKDSGLAVEQLLSGREEPDRGEIVLNGENVSIHGPHEALDLGITIVPEDDNILSDLSLSENVLLAALRTTGKKLLLNQSELRYLNDELLGEYCNVGNISIHGDEPAPHGWLVRKKIAFCRALASSPNLMVLSNPTQRIDFYSRQEIYEDILSLKKQHVSVLLISSNIDELTSVCDRIAVVQNGRLASTFMVDESKKELICIRYGNYIRDIEE